MSSESMGSFRSFSSSNERKRSFISGGSGLRGGGSNSLIYIKKNFF